MRKYEKHYFYAVEVELTSTKSIFVSGEYICNDAAMSLQERMEEIKTAVIQQQTRDPAERHNAVANMITFNNIYI